MTEAIKEGRRPATPEEIQAAKDEWDGVDEVDVDPDAQVSESEGGHWIQAWLWMPS